MAVSSWGKGLTAQFSCTRGRQSLFRDGGCPSPKLCSKTGSPSRPGASDQNKFSYTSGSSCCPAEFFIRGSTAGNPPCRPSKKGFKRVGGDLNYFGRYSGLLCYSLDYCRNHQQLLFAVRGIFQCDSTRGLPITQ